MVLLVFRPHSTNQYSDIDSKTYSIFGDGKFFKRKYLRIFTRSIEIVLQICTISYEGVNNVGKMRKT